MKLIQPTRPLAAMLALGGVLICDSAAAQQAAKAMPITVTQVETSDVAPAVPAAGTEVHLAAVVAAVVAAVMAAAV